MTELRVQLGAGGQKIHTVTQLELNFVGGWVTECRVDWHKCWTQCIFQIRLNRNREYPFAWICLENDIDTHENSKLQAFNPTQRTYSDETRERKREQEIGGVMGLREKFGFPVIKVFSWFLHFLFSKSHTSIHVCMVYIYNYLLEWVFSISYVDIYISKRIRHSTNAPIISYAELHMAIFAINLEHILTWLLISIW